MSKGPDHAAERFREKKRREEDHTKQLPGDDDESLPTPVEPIQAVNQPERNDPCPCGSGKKYKKCCGKAGG